MKNINKTIIDAAQALQDKNKELEKALKSMLNIFDRNLPEATVGRICCDKAKNALNK